MFCASAEPGFSGTELFEPALTNFCQNVLISYFQSLNYVAFFEIWMTCKIVKQVASALWGERFSKNLIFWRFRPVFFGIYFFTRESFTEQQSCFVFDVKEMHLEIKIPIESTSAWPVFQLD